MAIVCPSSSCSGLHSSSLLRQEASAVWFQCTKPKLTHLHLDHHILDRQEKVKHVRKIASKAAGQYDKRCAPQRQANALRHRQQGRGGRSIISSHKLKHGLYKHHHDQRAGRVRLHVRGLQFL